MDRGELAEVLHTVGKRARILLVNGSYLTWFGTRTLRGLGSRTGPARGDD